MPSTDGLTTRSPATIQTYTRDWDLFTNWCAVADRATLPADPATVVAFLQDCPAAVGTQRRRVTAIDHHHTRTGHAGPGKSASVLAALGRPTGEPTQIGADTAVQVDAALRLLPSHGWTHG